MRVRQRFLTAGDYGVAYYTADHLNLMALETSRAIYNGLPVCVLRGHVPPHDPRGLPTAEALRHSVGRLLDINYDADWLESYFEITDDDIADDIRAGRIRYTSPQISREFGPYRELITHIALTDKPRFRGQGPMRIEGVGQGQSMRETIAMNDVLLWRAGRRETEDDAERIARRVHGAGR